MNMLACILVSIAVAILTMLAGARAIEGVKWDSPGVKCFLRNFIMCGVPVAVLVFCCWFFWYAFDKTTHKNQSAVPTIEFHLASGSQSNAVERVVCGAEFQRSLKEMLTSREAIVRAEHEDFRAELGTWLSIFGLLSILATIVFSAASYVMQHFSLKEERETIAAKFKEDRDVFNKEKESLITRLTADITNSAVPMTQLQADMEILRADFLKLKKEYAEKHIEEIRNRISSFVVKWPSYQSQCLDRKVSFGDKIKNGIGILGKINGRLEVAQTPDENREYLKLINMMNVYFGHVNDDEFIQPEIRCLVTMRAVL